MPDLWRGCFVCPALGENVFLGAAEIDRGPEGGKLYSGRRCLFRYWYRSLQLGVAFLAIRQ